VIDWKDSSVYEMTRVDGDVESSTDTLIHSSTTTVRVWVQ